MPPKRRKMYSYKQLYEAFRETEEEYIRKTYGNNSFEDDDEDK